MNTNLELSRNLISSLELALPPVAIATADAAPADVPFYDSVAPAGCVFWQQAALRTFVTAAKDHALCAIGAHTHHMSQPARVHMAELAETLKTMSDLDYVRPEEVAAIPVIKRPVNHVIYGPLSEFPLFPEVVILFAHARQGLVLSEAAARVDRKIPLAMGRPACAIIPQVLNHGNAAMSLGCCGARAYLDVLGDELALWALPGGKLEQYYAEIAVLARANKTLTTFHTRRREDVEAGKRPTVNESLGRLSQP